MSYFCMQYWSHYEHGKGWSLYTAEIDASFLKLKSYESFAIQELNVSINHLKTTADLKISYRHIQPQGKACVHNAHVRKVLFHRVIYTAMKSKLHKAGPNRSEVALELDQVKFKYCQGWKFQVLSGSLVLCLNAVMVESFFKYVTGISFVATSHSWPLSLSLCTSEKSLALFSLHSPSSQL